MLDTLEARLAQAGAGELGHVELLGVLCADEASRRDTAGLERRLKAARFEQSVPPAGPRPSFLLRDAGIVGNGGRWAKHRLANPGGRNGSGSSAHVKRA